MKEKQGKELEPSEISEGINKNKTKHKKIKHNFCVEFQGIQFQEKHIVDLFAEE